GRDPPTATLVDDVRVLPLLLGHRVDHPLHALERDFRVFALGDQLGHPRHHADHVLHAHLLDVLEVHAEVIERELSLLERLLLLLHLFFGDLRLDLLDLFAEAHQVALSHDPAGHALRPELFDRLQLLADADELDLHSGDGLDRQGRAAASVAVELGQDRAVERQLVVKDLGDVHGFLADHRVDDQVDVIRLNLAVDLVQLVHQLSIDLEPAGGVENDHVEAVLFRVSDGVLADLDRVGCLRIDRDVDLLAEDLELLDGGGALQVGRDEEWATTLVAKLERQLAARGRLARPLEAAHHQDGRAILVDGDLVID